MMSRKLLAGIAGAVAMGMAVPAMAQEVQTATTDSTITVESTASIWSAATVQLTLNGTGAENYDLLESSLTHLNNTEANISVAIENGELATDLPDDMQYWLFRGMTEGAAYTELQNNAITDFTAGVFRFSGTDVNTGVATTLFATVPISTNTTTGDVLPVIYGADARASLPPVADHVTVVTWTIANNS